MAFDTKGIEASALDIDMEDVNEDGTDQDNGEHDDAEECEHTAPETYGRGWKDYVVLGSFDDDEDGHDRELKRDGVGADEWRAVVPARRIGGAR